MTVMTEPEADELAALIRTRGGTPLPLAGWGRRSTWGWDAQDGTLFAQLWRDDDQQDEPTWWIHPTVQNWPARILDLRVLARLIVTATGRTAADVYQALAASGPPALSRMILDEIAS